MPEQVIVNRKLNFTGGSTSEDSENIRGNWCTEKMVVYDDFTGTTLDSDRWVVASNNGGTEAITEAQGGTVTLTTGATNDDRSLLASPLILLAARNPIVEVRYKVTAAITTVGINICLSDATTEGNDALPMEITSGAATLVNSKATDVVGLVYDTDGLVDHWYMAATKNDTEGTPVLCRADGSFANITGKVRINPTPLASGSTTVTAITTGTFLLTIPKGCTGTLTNGGGTFTGSPKALTAGTNTVTCTVIGTATVVIGRTPLTTFQTVRIALDSSSNANFWMNGEHVGYLPTATTAATPLCLFLGVIARTTTARILTIDYIKMWQDRS